MTPDSGVDSTDANATVSDGAFDRIGALIQHVRIPLYRNAYSLVLSSVLTAGIGVVFWILATRLYTEEIVGINSAAISMLVFLATLGQLNLVNGLNRFLPRAGGAAGGLIGKSYLVAAGSGGVVAIVFLLGIDMWAADLSIVTSSSWMAIWFVVSVMAWCVFALQDGVLAGLRQAQWVPVENVIYALAKIVLVIGLAASFSDTGLFLAWTIPILPLLLLVNAGVFWGLLPRRTEEDEEHGEPIALSQISRFVAGDYTASLIWMAATRLLPVLVLVRVGAISTAHFYVAWTVAYTLYLISRNMGMSLITEASRDPLALANYSYRTARQAALLVVPAVIVIVVAAPLILGLFGDSYAEAGTSLLRLLALSAVPAIITTIYAAILRVERRIRTLVVLMLAQSGMVLVLSYWLLGTRGIVGVGIAWLVSQTLTATFVLVVELRPMWISQVDHRVVEAVVGARDSVRRRRTDREFRPIASAALEHSVQSTSMPVAASSDRWEILHIFATVSDVVTFTVGPNGEPPEAVLKIASTERGRESLDRHIAVIRELEDDDRLSGWKGGVPHVQAVAESGGRRIFIDPFVDGEPLTGFLRTADDPCGLLTPPAATIAEMHRRTASERDVDGALLELLVHKPARAVKEPLARRPEWVEVLDATEDRLATELRRETLTVSRTHGDFAPGNVLLSPDGGSVAGIVDWDQAVPLGLPDLDLVFLLLSARMVRQRRELGSVVATLVEQSAFADWEQDLLNRYGLNASLGIDTATLVELAWLHHAASNLTKASTYRNHEMWLERNIGHVLRTH